jgi:hypothetical protein
MIRQRVSLLLILLMLHAGVAQALGPQNPTPAKVTRTRDFVMKRGTGEKTGIKIRLSDKTQIKGFISQAGSDDFVVVDSKTGAATSVAHQNVIEITRSGLSRVRRSPSSPA